MVRPTATPSPKARKRKSTPVEDQQVQASLDKILQSTIFRRSERMSRFLQALVTAALSGNKRIAEAKLAEQVFDRKDFDPRTDPIVRVEARRLRRCLIDYYRDEGAADPIEIKLSSRGYSLSFEKNGTQSVAMQDSGDAPAVAVLPFTNLTNDPGQVAFCMGVGEELVNELTQSDDVKVIARSSTNEFVQDHSVRQIGRELGATAILEGSVRKIDQQLRVTAQLSRTSDGLNVWSETFDMKADDSFAVQEKIAKTIARTAEVNLTELAKTA